MSIPMKTEYHWKICDEIKKSEIFSDMRKCSWYGRWKSSHKLIGTVTHPFCFKMARNINIKAAAICQSQNLKDMLPPFTMFSAFS